MAHVVFGCTSARWGGAGPSSLLLVAALAGVLSASGAALAAAPEYIAHRVEPSLVRVFVTGPQSVATGTGFVVANGGWIVTNHHVVAPHTASGWVIEVLPSGDEAAGRLAAELSASWPDEDLALLKVPGLERPALTFAAHSKLESGASVFVSGFPGAADRLGPVGVASFAQGIVSRRFEGRWSSNGPLLTIIQHSAAINPGNSGGPLLNTCGDVVGVNTQREVRAIVGPFGVPLVSDPIQDLFFSSDVSAVLARLGELQLAPRVAAGVCGDELPWEYYWMAAALAAIVAAAAVTGTALILRRRSVVVVLVRCEALLEDCMRTVRRALFRSRHGT